MDLELTPILLFLAPRSPPYASLRIKITFKESNGETIKTVEGNEGDDLLSIAHEYDVDLEGTSFLSAAAGRTRVSARHVR